MFIIWGWRNIEGRGRPGTFHCPNCGDDHPYRLKTPRTWFTLYFIPVIPLQKVGEFVRCGTCKGAFIPEVLERPSSAGVPAAGPAVLNPSAALREGMPIETLKRRLMDQGIDEWSARDKVDRAAGDQRKTCVRCGLTYHRSLSTCTECGERLA